MGREQPQPLHARRQHLLPTNSAIYETLFFVNSLNGKVTPVLGTKYAWSNDNKTLTVTTRRGVKWTDGQAFSASDVGVHLQLPQEVPGLDLSGIWKNGLTSVKATNATTVVFNFSKANTPIFPFIANTPIVPEHLWAPERPGHLHQAKPVGTGPFVFDSYSQQALRVLKNPNYWMKGQPYVDAVVWLSTNGNDAALLKMLKGEADYGYIGISDPKAYTKQNKNTSYWWPVNNTNFLYFNTAKAPFNDVDFRRAIAGAIDTKEVALKAYAGVVPAAEPSAIIPAQQASGCPARAKNWTSNTTRRQPTRPSRRRATRRMPRACASARTAKRCPTTAFWWAQAGPITSPWRRSSATT